MVGVKIRLSKNLWFPLVSLCVVLSVAPPVYADSPFEAPVLSAQSFDSAISNSLAETSEVTVINPVDRLTVTARLRTLGNITLHFNREWHVPAKSYSDNGFAQQKLDDETRGMHLQGYAVVRAAPAGGKRKKVKVPVAATVFHLTSSHPTIEAEFHADATGDGGHFFQLKGALANRTIQKLLKVRRISRHAFSGKTCGVNASTTTTLEPVIRKSKLSATPVKTSSLLSFDLATEADYDWFVRYGSSSNTKIQSILNKVQTIYEAQLSLTFNLTKQVVVSTSGSRYTSGNVETLLDSFRTYTENHSQLGSADVHHLFTGKNTYVDDGGGNTNDSVIGLAYLGVVCAFPTYTYGLTEHVDDALDHVTTAHEIGHNLNAQHDTAGSIMGTELDVNNPPTQFSTTSRNQISSFVSGNSSCLSSASATPTPTSGGGGTNPGSGDTSHVSLTTSLNSKGQFTLKTVFSELGSNCTAEVRASTRSGGVYNGSGTLIASLDPDFLRTIFSKVPVKRRGSQRVYFGVTKVCGDETYYSMTRSVDTTKVSSTRSTLSGSAWIKLLKSKVQTTTPSKS